ncbi:MAG: Thymidylate synthase thyX, partial [Thermoleophilia bacterium]|nr:Thymidylate synthase thyX [Thermoleophilia bacterium]
MGNVCTMTTSELAAIERLINVHNHGHVHLEDSMGSDLHIVNNARVSFDQESAEFTPKERGLLNFLMRERHGSPWESVIFRFDVKAPIFVIREWQRHRISSFNEQSARYSVIPDEFYVPEADLVRGQFGKPGSYEFRPIEDPAVVESTLRLLDETQQAAFAAYREMLEMGVAKELARTVLPVGMFSRMKWTVNLRGLFNFLSLRNHEHAQREIRDYAIAVEELAKTVFPVAF